MTTRWYLKMIIEYNLIGNNNLKFEHATEIKQIWKKVVVT